MIDVPTLIAAGVGPTQARAFADPLKAACALYGIDTPLAQAAFIAQCIHESQGFVHLEENLYYSSPERIIEVFRPHIHGRDDAMKLVKNPEALANRVYSSRMGNGDEASGDGWTFRGAGLIQLTGRAMHAAFAAATGRPLLPALLREPDGAVESAAWYWNARALTGPANAGDIDACSRVINGGTLGINERRETYRIVLSALTGAPRTTS